MDNKVVTKSEYLKALNIIEVFQSQLNIHKETKRKLIDSLGKDDYIEYIGGSRSRYLTKGKKYRMTCSPWDSGVHSSIVRVIADEGVWMRVNRKFFMEFV